MRTFLLLLALSLPTGAQSSSGARTPVQPDATGGGGATPQAPQPTPSSQAPAQDTTGGSTPAPLTPAPLTPAPLTPPPVGVADLRATLLVEEPVVGVTLELTLRNDSGTDQEFDLLLPLGTGTAISDLVVDAGSGPLQGQLFDGDAARVFYRDVAKKLDRPALLEHYGEALYRARVSPVPANGTRDLSIRYQRLVGTEDDRRLLHLPLSAFRRAGSSVVLSIEGEIRTSQPLSTLYSPTHDVIEDGSWETWEESLPRYHTRFRTTTAPSTLDTDLQLLFKANRGDSPFDVTVLSQRPNPNEPGTFLAVLHGMPDDTIVPEPKNVVFVLDHSGSMKGAKIEQARAALRYLVSRLRPEDRFNLVSYSVEAKPFADGLLAATPQVKDEVAAFLEGVEAQGGTNIEAALTTALGLFTDDRHLNQIVFMTDGLPTEGEKATHPLCKMVNRLNDHDARIITFGLGFDVNGDLLDRLALGTRGLAEYVLPDQKIEEAVPAFYARMQAPLLLDAEIAITGVTTHDVYPRETGDLYGGHQIVLTGRYAEPGDAKLVIRGRRGTELQEFEFPLPLTADSSEERSDLVGRIWAAKKIGYLVDDIRLVGETEERVAAVVDLGTRYGILTEYTAFLAAEDTDLLASADNWKKCSMEIEKRTSVTSGTHGVAQACNSKSLQRGDQALSCNSWVGANGETVVVNGVQCVSGKTFFKRGTTWLDHTAKLADAEDVELYSDEFFGLLDRNPWLGRCVARTGDVTLELEGRTVRIRKS